MGFRLLLSVSLLLLMMVMILPSPPSVQACGVCVLTMPPSAAHRFRAPSVAVAASAMAAALARRRHPSPRSVVLYGLAAGAMAIHRKRRMRAVAGTRGRIPLWALQDGETPDKDASDTDDNDEDSATVSREKPPMTTAMVASIGVYKRFISPLLPPACRFLPTCSQYGVQAIEEFGPGKGAILTAWRILRCSPLGGKGYDPPRWPPVPFTYSSY